MALVSKRFSKRRPLFALLGLSLLIAAGCQSTTTTSTAGLPGPNFAGPSIRPPAYTPPVIAALPPTPRPSKPSPMPPANVPTSWIPIASAEHREWTWIVVHHSATEVGGASRFDRDHKAKGWDELGYHFVIGNGSDTPDGAIEVGPRWPIQKHGAHAKTPDNKYNEHGIGICLVGNMDNHPPTQKQLASLTRLAAYLADTYHIRQSDIIGHKMTGKQTDCPGKYTDINQIRQLIAARRTMVTAEAPGPQPGDELMQTAAR